MTPRRRRPASASFISATALSMPRRQSWTRETTMLPLYRTLSLRYLSRRWFRALLIVASIALGVAALVATRALNETMSKAALNAGNPMAGVADLVVSNGEMPIAKTLAGEISQVPGVKSVRARLFENARL